MTPLDILSVNTIRLLAADGVEKAKSGHPGMPMGAAAMAYAIWTRNLKHNPANPAWHNRDRFILSGGHGSMLLYSLLHLAGYDLALDDLKQFRQWESKTPGHPEYGHTAGVEMTTGPLGQGFSSGVGMAIAQRYLAARYNKPDFNVIDYTIYAICGDGDLMEGVASEAASLAGHLKLGNLVCLYDDNRITIEGSTRLAFTEDVAKRFEAYGWHVQRVQDGNDVEAIDMCIKNARAETVRPSLIMVQTVIGCGAPNKQDTAGVHGAPLGAEELKLAKKGFGFDPEKSFVIPDDVLNHFRSVCSQSGAAEAAWNELMRRYAQQYPAEAAELNGILNNLPGDAWKKALPVFTAENGAIATRAASQKVINAIAPHLPGLIGGSADLAESTLTLIKGEGDFLAGSYGARNMHFGVREHAMGSLLNGMAFVKGLRPYGATFFVFADYMRPPIRLAALMKLSPIYVFTHDSIGLGEDGPTHQPVEQMASLRAIPNMTLIRPADANEVSVAWKLAVESTTGPVALALTRQKTLFIDRTKYAPAEGIERGAYILAESGGTPQIILIGSGSELQFALAAYEKLAQEGTAVRLVNMASWELFERQPQSYRDSILPPAVKSRVAIEAGIGMGWERYVGPEGIFIGMQSFGASAPYEVLYKQYGFTADNVYAQARQLLQH